MESVPPSDKHIKETRAAYLEACALLGYESPNGEADGVIDLLGATEDGARGARLAAFYPETITLAIDRAARLARRYPEALLPEPHLPLLDLLVRASR